MSAEPTAVRRGRSTLARAARVGAIIALSIGLLALSVMWARSYYFTDLVEQSTLTEPAPAAYEWRILYVEVTATAATAGAGDL